VTASAGSPPPGTPVRAVADSAVVELGPERVLLSGDVELVYGDTRFSADELSLDQADGLIEARGNLLLEEPALTLAGSAASYQLLQGTGRVEDVSYRLPGIGARGEAEHAELLGGKRSRYQGLSYTTCAVGKDDWLLRADTLDIDQAEGLGTARNASLRFQGVPILYAPWFSFPVDDRRRSGLLVPSVGYGSNTGVDVSVPYYLNLAPNYDLTLTPRLMSKRGLLLGSEFRFLTETTDGVLTAEYMPDDREYDGSSSDRGSASLFSETRLGERSLAALRLGYVSDDSYLKDLGSSLAVTSTRHIERAAEFTHQGDYWRFLARLQGYQTIDEQLLLADRPYSRLPQLRLDLSQPDGPAGSHLHLGAEYAYFHRRDSVRGHRIDLAPAVSLPWRNSWAFVEPRLGARYTAYRLEDQPPGQDDAPAHATELASLDAGLFFDRPVDWFGSAATQTLEPRAYYLYVPSDAQNDQPVFDTAPFDFSFDNLFRDNRYNGPDRVGDANQLTLALTSRIHAADSGRELLRASLGQILYFEDREVVLPGEPVQRDDTSALVGEISARLGRGWQTRAGLQWDPHDGDQGTIEQALAQLSYQGEGGRVFSAAYRLREDVTRHTDLAVRWPIGGRWSLVGRHHYSLEDDRLLEALGGFEYASCCWRLRTLLRSYTDDLNSDRNLAFFLQLELNGLGRLGDDIDQVLARGIYGYRTDDDE
jgi:LPS-assembly protein